MFFIGFFQFFYAAKDHKDYDQPLVEFVGGCVIANIISGFFWAMTINTYKKQKKSHHDEGVECYGGSLVFIEIGYLVWFIFGNIWYFKSETCKEEMTDLCTITLITIISYYVLYGVWIICGIIYISVILYDMHKISSIKTKSESESESEEVEISVSAV